MFLRGREFLLFQRGRRQLHALIRRSRTWGG
jgi:hypothetical protein